MDKYYYKYLKYKSKYLKLSQIGGNLTEIVNNIVKLLGEPIYNQDRSNEPLYIRAALTALGIEMDEGISLEENANKVLTRLQQMNIPELAKIFYLDENTQFKVLSEDTDKKGWVEANFKKIYIYLLLKYLDIELNEKISLEDNAKLALVKLEKMPTLAEKLYLDGGIKLIDFLNTINTIDWTKFEFKKIYKSEPKHKYIDSSASSVPSTLPTASGSSSGSSSSKAVDRLETIPQLCFGTAQGNLDHTLPIALANGIVNIDGADGYGREEYLQIIRENIQKIPREKLWITWKSDYITKENIQRIIDSLECGYIDTYLIHHYDCYNIKQLEILDGLKRSGLIRHYGLSNCEDINKIIKLKESFDIETIQIQARPPEGVIQGRRKINLNDFINRLNEIGINVMLYGTISGVQNLEDYSVVYENLENINKYYIQKYCLGKPNILMIGSQYGTKIVQNITDFDNIMGSKDLLDSRKMNEIETQLEQLELSFQG
jgi:diketogulonate reductase-like aldo/keto reductase